MERKYQVLLYLERKRFLYEMEIACKHFLSKIDERTVVKFPPLRYVLEVDTVDLIDFLPGLGIFLLKEPLQWQSICSDILNACLLTFNSRYFVQSSQVAVILRPKNLSRLLSRHNPRNHKGLDTFYGMLTAISKPASYVYHTVWSCPELCEGNEVILQCIPKAPPKCQICRSVLFENSGLRRCGEQVTATFKLKNDLLPRSLKIVDDLIPKLKLGSKFQINAFVVKKITAVCFIEEVAPLPAPITSPIPKDIEELFDTCHGLSWQFIYRLASSIEEGVCPSNCFMHLKINLLLSLASIKANTLIGSTIIHVLAAGNDSGYVGRIMEEVAQIADESILLGTSNTDVTSALTASSGGVCVMALPMHIYSQKQISSILSCIETGEVSTDVPLRSAVWAQGKDFKKITILNVGSVFGTVCRGDYGEYNDEIVDFFLQNAVQPKQESTVQIQALKDIALYIDLTAGINVSLQTDVENLLRNYFLAARKERPRGVTVSCMGALVATCVTSARLCRRSVANIDDAVFAIWLHASGSPEPRFAPEEYLQTPADFNGLKKIINSFKDWLEQFTGLVSYGAHKSLIH